MPTLFQSLLPLLVHSCSLLITSMFAYTLSPAQSASARSAEFLRCVHDAFQWGGLVPSYMIYSTVFHIKDTIFALLIPTLLMNAFSIILVRSYFTNSIPPALQESAKIDGASEFGIYRRIIIPMSFPIMATVGLLVGLAYWNDWTNGLIYLTKNRPVQPAEFIEPDFIKHPVFETKRCWTEHQ